VSRPAVTVASGSGQRAQWCRAKLALHHREDETMELCIRGLATESVERIRQGAPDGNGQPALTRPATGLDPCRHCLGIIAEGDTKLVLAYRPFDAPQPYAETGPIFLHRKACARYESDAMPGWFDFLQPAIVRGYDEDDWIRYDTGDVVPGRDLAAASETILDDPSIAYVHIRSKFNCFQCRVDRA
jgi:hypothetical protein